MAAFVQADASVGTDASVPLSPSGTDAAAVLPPYGDLSEQDFLGTTLRMSHMYIDRYSDILDWTNMEGQEEVE